MSDGFARQMRRRADQQRRRDERQQRRREYGKGTPTKLYYHGTAAALADSIEAGGLRLGRDGRAYLTSSREVAYAYAAWSTGLASIVGGGTFTTTATDVGRRVATLGQHVAAIALVRLPVDYPLTVEDAFPPPLPWSDEIAPGECFYAEEPIPGWAVSGWEFHRVDELYDERSLAALCRDSELITHAFSRSRAGKAGGPFRAAIPDPVALVEAVCEASPNVSSPHHGAQHWLQVCTMGQRLLRADERPDADATIVFLFGLLHDSQRHAEGRDPEHGARAAQFARNLVEDGLLTLDDRRMALLCDALTHHDQGGVSDDDTIGTCFDADRLCLARLGIQPDPALLSTAAGRALAPDARRLVLLPTDWRFAIFRFSLEAAAYLIDDDMAVPA